MYRQDVERSAVIVQSGDNEGSTDLLARKSTERFDPNLVDGVSGEQGESPLPVFDALDGATPRPLRSG